VRERRERREGRKQREKRQRDREQRERKREKRDRGIERREREQLTPALCCSVWKLRPRDADDHDFTAFVDALKQTTLESIRFHFVVCSAPFFSVCLLFNLILLFVVQPHLVGFLTAFVSVALSFCISLHGNDLGENGRAAQVLAAVSADSRSCKSVLSISVWSGPGLVWSGLVWSGLVWSGLGLVWSGLSWSELVWCSASAP
jgi:hypothetical protein